MADTRRQLSQQDILEDVGDLTNANNLRDVAFTPQQLAHLERIFPESSMGSTTTDAQLRHYAGQRSVVLYVRTRVKR